MAYTDRVPSADYDDVVDMLRAQPWRIFQMFDPTLLQDAVDQSISRFLSERSKLPPDLFVVTSAPAIVDAASRAELNNNEQMK